MLFVWLPKKNPLPNGRTDFSKHDCKYVLTKLFSLVQLHGRFSGFFVNKLFKLFDSKIKLNVWLVEN